MGALSAWAFLSSNFWSTAPLRPAQMMIAFLHMPHSLRILGLVYLSMPRAMSRAAPRCRRAEPFEFRALPPLSAHAPSGAPNE